MEAKTVIMSVLIMNLVMAQFQVEADVSCPSKVELGCYGVCCWERKKIPNSYCASACGCQLLNGYSGVAVNEYCKLGCVSSVCGAMNALQNSDVSGIGNGSVEKCAEACSTFCTKGSTTGDKTA